MTTPGEASGRQATVRSVERALDILLILESRGVPLRLVDLSRASGLHTATLLRLLGVLQRRGFVASENQTYRIGPVSLALAYGFRETDPLTQRAQPILMELSERTGLTSSLYGAVEDDRILITTAAGREPLHYQMPVGKRSSILVGAGKVIAASWPEDRIEALLARTGGYVRADGRQVGAEEVREQLADARRDGHVIHIGDRDLGVAALSVPVRDAAGEVKASLSVASPSERQSAEQLLEKLPEALRASSAIGAIF